MKLATIAESFLGSSRDHVAIVSPDGEFTFREVAAGIAELVSELSSQGVEAGHRVVAITDHDEAAVFLLAAASALGVRLVVPYNLQAAAIAEWAGIVASCRPDHVVFLRRDCGPLEALRAAVGRVVVPRRPEEVRRAGAPARPLVISAPDPVSNFLVLFTSGTTGRPKAISISEALICRRVVSVSKALHFARHSRIFMSGLMNNTTGIIFSFGSLLHGARLFVPGHRDVERWPEEVDRHGSTHIMLRPAAMQRFVDGARASGATLRSMKVVGYGAAAVSPRVLSQARALMPCSWIQGYGLSETFGPFCWLTEDDHRQGKHERFVYCVGRPDTTLQVEVRSDPAPERAAGSVGEIFVRGDCLMEGYYDVARGGVDPVGDWFRTGDYAEQSPEGDLVLKGRVASTILSEDGHRIFPEEVEGVLKALAGVDDAVLLGLPSATNLGSSPVAFITGPLASATAGELRAALQRQLARFLSPEKWPRYAQAHRAPFPLNDNGKVVRAEVHRSLAPNALVDLTPGARVATVPDGRAAESIEGDAP